MVIVCSFCGGGVTAPADVVCSGRGVSRASSYSSSKQYPVEVYPHNTTTDSNAMNYAYDNRFVVID